MLDTLVQTAQERPLTAQELGLLSDLYSQFRKDRLAADKVAAELKTKESKAEALLIEQMLKQEITAAGGKTLRVSLAGPDYVPHVVDWTVFYNHILETGDFSFLERRPGKAACRERWEAGIQVPGVEKFPVYKLSRNEVK